MLSILSVRDDYRMNDLVLGEIMTQYLVAVHHPDDYDPSRDTNLRSQL